MDNVKWEIQEKSLTNLCGVSMEKSMHKAIAIDESPWTVKWLGRLLWALFLVMAGMLFFPWTQNIQATGTVTTLLPGQRPQQVQTIIGGRIEKWYVREGVRVKKGDTIVYLSEVKDSYLDPNLLGQTNIQIGAKENSLESYTQKVDAINRQIKSLEEIRDIKFKQADNKVQQEELALKSEMAEYEAAKNDFLIAKTRYSRDSQLYAQGLKSALDLEGRRLKVQESTSKLISAENKISSTKAALEIAKFERSNLFNEFNEKLSKAESDRFTAISSQMETEAEISKLRNSYSNYKIRSGFYFITAPQDGFITQVMSSGIGETVKEGAAVCTIVPSDYYLAVEMYVEPMDLPLIHHGSKVRFLFDGWPALVFSGWPGLTFGTFPGKVVGIDNVPNNYGKYRLLVAPDNQEKRWPEQLRVGTGARGIALLKRVPVWYELWRRLNGFPPDYYTPNNGSKTTNSGPKGK